VDAAAIRVLDAWWPLLVRAEFHDGLGDAVYRSIVDAMQVNESPSAGQRGDVSTLPTSAAENQTHKGSSFQHGWWGYVEKDLRAVLGEAVPGWTAQRFCGGGNLASCRQTLLDTLRQAAARPATAVYPGEASRAAGDQWCADAISHQAIGGITDPLVAWQNRPTYQQVVSFPARHGDNVANLALGRPVSVTSTQLFFSKAAAATATARPAGAAAGATTSRLPWTSARAWRTVFSTGTGDGETDNVRFPATSARYARMAGVQRATSFGYSLWELEVYLR
jgi:hypothetical protein